MAVAEPCRECGVLDALERHAGDCPRALEMGLPRLADGEEPIDPVDEASYEVADEPVEVAEPDPLLTVARERDVVRDKRVSDLWMAFGYNPDNDDGSFDAVVFDSELDALRYAVAAHWQVLQVELGRSLAEQATNAP
jgi:hypothetical protein